MIAPFDNGYRKALDDIKSQNPKGLYTLKVKDETKIEGWADDIKDRIEYNGDNETIYEVVMVGANVHLEQMDDSRFMLIAENEKHMWHLNISSRSGRAKVDARLYGSEDKNER